MEKLNDDKKSVVEYSGDTTAGSGFGMGSTGIPDKVTKGIEKILEEVANPSCGLHAGLVEGVHKDEEDDFEDESLGRHGMNLLGKAGC